MAASSRFKTLCALSMVYLVGLAAGRPPPSPSPAAASPPPPPPATPAASPEERPFKSGRATVYGGHPAGQGSSPAMDTSQLACGMAALTFWGQTHAAAINLALHPAACGLCLLAVCADSATCPPDKAAAQPLVVVDDCGSCAADHILVAPAAFKNLTGYGQGGRPLPASGWAAVAFRFVPCAPFFATYVSISMRILPGGNAFYRQITFSNAGEHISAASINSQALHRGSSQLRWEWDGRGRPLNTTAPLAVQLTSVSGRTLLAQLPALKEGQQQLGVQFV